MGNLPKNHAGPASHDDFETLQRGLTVEMIATKRCDLETCRKNELVSDVMGRMSTINVSYDYLPVTDAGSNGPERIVGLYPTKKRAAGERDSAERVHERLCPLSEDFVIGAKASILDYIVNRDAKPVRFLVSETGFVGLVTLSDLQKPPARVALFALVNGFEVTMSNVIRSRCPCDVWMQYISSTRRRKLEEQIERSQSEEQDDFVERLLFTQFCDKRDILIGSKALEHHCSNSQALKDLKKIEALRDGLAHANDYATSEVPEVVMTLLNLRRCLEEVMAGWATCRRR